MASTRETSFSNSAPVWDVAQTVAPSEERGLAMLRSGEIPHEMDRCREIGMLRARFERVMWGGLAASGTVWGASKLLGGDDMSPLGSVRTPALVVTGGVTAIAAIGKFITGTMLQRCTNRILDHFGARPTTSPTYAVPDVEDDVFDPDERSIANYAVSAEAVSRRATGAKAVANGVLVVTVATAAAAVSAALYLLGIRGGAATAPVTSGFGATLDGGSGVLGRQDTVL